MTRFLERNGETFRLLLQGPDEIWLISYDTPSRPFLVMGCHRGYYRRTQTPQAFLDAAKGSMTAAQNERLKLIQPLLDGGEQAVVDNQFRLERAKEIAEEHRTTARRVLRLYYRYLATGVLVSRKVRGQQQEPIYDKAIRDYYYSAKKFSLRRVYDMMLVERFMGTDGKLEPNAPTWESFRHYFYSRGCHKTPRKIISREGLTNFQRNHRPALGSASAWREVPGAYQMDATVADIHLVSRIDHSTVIGRPYLYLAVDTATQLIAGMHVSMDAGEGAVIRCIENAACDKVEYCRAFGVSLEADQWPSRGLPHEIITDKGREFLGGRMGEICRRYGVEVQSLPPFRPDGKGLVEKAFDLLQQRYKPLLRGKGVIEPDAQERWATDYRSQALLTVDEFTAVLIHCVSYLNAGRLLQDGRTPAQHWIEASPQLLEVPAEELRLLGLPREQVKFTRKGISFRAMRYIPEDADGLCPGDTYTLVYDPADIGSVYVMEGEKYIRCTLSPAHHQFQGLSQAEVSAQQRLQQYRVRQAKAHEIEASTASIKNIQGVIGSARLRRDMSEPFESEVE